MKQISLIFIAITGLFISCYKPYDADISTDKRVLVVNGMITNETASYKVQLSYAMPFDSSGSGIPVTSAKIFITDSPGNIYFFNEKGKGYYASDSLQFTGIPGNIYTLHITTPGGDRYKSDPQKLFPGVQPDSVYAEFGFKETLSRNTGLYELTHGANILIDIKNQADTLPHFLIKADNVIQYIYTVCPIYQFCSTYYCWQTINATTDINLTGEGFSLNTASVNKHEICFIDDNLYCIGLTYDQGVSTTEYNKYMVHHRIIFLKQYTLNNETYLYYKRMNEQLRSDGKLFDPIAVQLSGNIRCVTDPDKQAFGFFEASSVIYSAYMVDFRNLNNNQPTLRKTPYILPPKPVGCLVNEIPFFWIL
jgi:hypothetical protein